MISVDECPVCKKSAIEKHLSCKDYTVSGEIFDIAICKNCGFKFTNPRPLEEKIGDYYKSENYISHSDSDKGIINKLYKNVRKITLKQKYTLINKLNNSEKSLLDVGCGTGYFIKECMNNGWKAMGIEPDPEARKLAIKNTGTDIHDELYFKSIKNETFDIITLWHVLEHVHNLNERIKELKRILKPQGKLIIAVPNCNSYDAKYYQEYWAAYDLPRHLYHFTPKDMDNLMSKHGFMVKDIQPMKFDSFYVSLLSEKYKKNTVNYFTAFKVALKSNLKAAKSKKHTYSSQIYIMEKNLA